MASWRIPLMFVPFQLHHIVGELAMSEPDRSASFETEHPDKVRSECSGARNEVSVTPASDTHPVASNRIALNLQPAVQLTVFRWRRILQLPSDWTCQAC